MRILEQTEDVLTLQNPARDFWFGMIVLFFSGPPLTIMFAMSGGLWFLFSLVTTSSFCLALQQIWASDVVRKCSFNKALGRITIQFHGLQTKSKNLQLQEIRAVEVRESIGFYYGAVEISQLWLVTRFAEAIPLSEEHYGRHNNASLQAIADQVREFLSLGRSMKPYKQR